MSESESASLNESRVGSFEHNHVMLMSLMCPGSVPTSQVLLFYGRFQVLSRKLIFRLCNDSGQFMVAAYTHLTHVCMRE